MSSEGFVRWRFLTVHMWGEPAPGEWQLTIESEGNGELTYFELVLYGTRYQTDKTAAPCRQFSLLSNDGSGMCLLARITQQSLNYRKPPILIVEGVQPRFPMQHGKLLDGNRKK